MRNNLHRLAQVVASALLVDDVTAKKAWDLGEKQHLEASFAVTNVYNRRNIFYYDTPKAQRVNQLPIMPTLLLSYAL